MVFWWRGGFVPNGYRMTTRSKTRVQNLFSFSFSNENKENNGFLGEGRHCSKWVQNDTKDQNMGAEFGFVFISKWKYGKIMVFWVRGGIVPNGYKMTIKTKTWVQNFFSFSFLNEKKRNIMTFWGEGRHCFKWVQNDNQDQNMDVEFGFVFIFKWK